MASPEQKISEIRRPPSLANWVRLNHRRRDETTRNITRFVLGKPRHALAQVYKIISDYVTFGISAVTVNAALDRIVNPLVRRLGKEIALVVMPWLDSHDIRGIQVFHDMVAPFPIGRGITVPVKPSFVFLEEGKLTPVFLIGWASMPFSDYQMSLLATIIDRAILSQEGFEGSDALVIFVPRITGSKSERLVRSWRTSEKRLLSDQELKDQFDRFGNALDDAVPVILEELARRGA
jgi:hypothetical protein